MITSIALVAITIALLFIMALVNKLWAIVQLQSSLLEMSRARIAKLERAMRESEHGDEANGGPA